MESIKNKAERALRIVKWTLSFIVISIVSLPGIIISLQYRKDDYITNTNYINVELDEWILIASFGYIIMTFSFIPCVCCKVRKRYFRTGIVLYTLIGMAWAGIGTYLMINSDLKSCSHDSLWIVSLVNLTSLGFFVLIELMYGLYLICRWKQRQILTPNDSVRFGWLDDYDFEDNI